MTSGLSILLPAADGHLVEHAVGEPCDWEVTAEPPTSRVAYAAAHVVPDVLADNVPGAPAVVDWESTLAYRHAIWAYGLGVADAMDTAQRGMGVDWPCSSELIRRVGSEAASVGGALACGAGTDQLDPTELRQGREGLRQVLEAYREQVAVVESSGAVVILMASRALARVARGPEDYLDVYGTLLAEVSRPVILHWLGPMFDVALTGYWGSESVARATDTVAALIESHRDVVDGIKVSLLDVDHEKQLRSRLPQCVRLYTGDDYNYPELIVGDAEGHSDALLGAFAAIYPAAAQACRALDHEQETEALELLESTQALSRKLFEPPTPHYKTGIAFLSWLNGMQPGFCMAGGMHGSRSVPHLVDVFTLADRAGLLRDPELAVARLSHFLTVQGVGAR